MSKKKNDPAPQSFPEKWYKVVTAMPEFKDIADSASEEDLKKIIVECEGNIYTAEQEKAANIQLTNAKELVKDYSAPHNEAIKAQTAKIKYSLFLLEGKGVNLDSKA